MPDPAYLTRAIDRLEAMRDEIFIMRRINRRIIRWLDQRAARRAMR